MHHPTDRIIHTTAFVTPVVEHWLERDIAQCVHHEGSIRRPIAPWANALTTDLHLAPKIVIGVWSHALLYASLMSYPSVHTHFPTMKDDWSIYFIFTVPCSSLIPGNNRPQWREEGYVTWWHLPVMSFIPLCNDVAAFKLGQRVACDLSL